MGFLFRWWAFGSDGEVVRLYKSLQTHTEHYAVGTYSENSSIGLYQQDAVDTDKTTQGILLYEHVQKQVMFYPCA